MVKLFYKDKPVLGLDINLTGIKVMVIDPKHWTVHGYGSVDLDPASMQNVFDSGNNTYLVENLSKLLKSKFIGTLPSNHVAIAVPTSRTFSRTFILPKDQESNIANAVDVEVNQYIPMPASSLYVDFEVIERNKDSGELTVNMAAIPKNIVDACTSAAWAAGLRPVLVEPGMNAIGRLLEKTEHGTLSTLIIDIGQTATDIAIYDSGAVRVTGGLNIGALTFTSAIVEKLRVTPENAHQLKVLNGLSASPRRAKIQAALEPSLNRIVAEVHKIIRYHKERINQDSQIEQVLIVGAGSDMPGIGDYFTDKLIMPARVASPWQQLKFGKLPQPNKQFRPRYITVTGLASIDKEEILK